MPFLHQYDYIFAIGTLAAALDAYVSYPPSSAMG
jgi:hypothetical protein